MSASVQSPEWLIVLRYGYKGKLFAVGDRRNLTFTPRVQDATRFTYDNAVETAQECGHLAELDGWEVDREDVHAG